VVPQGQVAHLVSQGEEKLQGLGLGVVEDEGSAAVEEKGRGGD